MKKNKPAIVTIVYCFLLMFQAYTNAFTQGEKLFRENKPAEALPYLVEAAAGENPPPVVFNYLGFVYTQLLQYDAAIEAFTRGTAVPLANVPLLYFNAGNAAFFAANYELAVELYGKSFEADPFYAKPVLNRANARVKQTNLELALNDYLLFLQLEPTAPQGQQIRQLVALIEADLTLTKAIESAKQVEAETQKKQAETEAIRKLEEQKRLAEKTRLDAERQKLLDEISSSLKASDSKNISAGSEGALEYNYEPKLE